MTSLRSTLVCLAATMLASAAGSAAAADYAVMRGGAVFDGAELQETRIDVPPQVRALPGFDPSIAVLRRYVGMRNGLAFVHNAGGEIAVAVVADDPGTGVNNLSAFNGWRVVCYHDAMTDGISCGIERTVSDRNRDDADTVFYTDGSNVCVIANDFPGRRAMVRVDGHPAETAVADGGRCLPPDAAQRVLLQLRRGEALRTRYYEWPYDYPQDAALPTTGLDVAFELLGWLRANTVAPGLP